MRVAKVAAVAALVCAIAPAAVAEKLPPHSDFYDQHGVQRTPGNDVGFLVRRTTGKADLFVSNFCLGTEHGPPDYPDQAITRSAVFRHHQVSFDGKATVYTRSGQRQVALKFSATVTSSGKKATGTVELPGTSCPKISFTARRTGHTA